MTTAEFIKEVAKAKGELLNKIDAAGGTLAPTQIESDAEHYAATDLRAQGVLQRTRENKLTRTSNPQEV